jgi:hypothetical protein
MSGKSWWIRLLEALGIRKKKKKPVAVAEPEQPAQPEQLVQLGEQEQVQVAQLEEQVQFLILFAQAAHHS